MDEAPSPAALLALEVLTLAMRDNDPECVRSSQALFAQVAASQPAELLRWVDDLPDRDAQFIGRRWLRGTLAGLPSEIRDAIRTRTAPDEIGVRREG